MAQVEVHVLRPPRCPKCSDGLVYSNVFGDGTKVRCSLCLGRSGLVEYWVAVEGRVRWLTWPGEDQRRLEREVPLGVVHRPSRRRV